MNSFVFGLVLFAQGSTVSPTLPAVGASGSASSGRAVTPSSADPGKYHGEAFKGGVLVPRERHSPDYGRIQFEKVRRAVGALYGIKLK